MITGLSSPPLTPELSMPKPPGRAEAFNSFDCNGNGALDTAELTALGENYSSKTGKEFDLDAIMSQFDTDSNGSLNEDEGLAVLDRLQEMAGGPPPPRPGRQDPAGFEDQYRANADAMGYSSSLFEILA